jgi:hypothetical protein
MDTLLKGGAVRWLSKTKLFAVVIADKNSFSPSESRNFILPMDCKMTPAVAPSVEQTVAATGAETAADAPERCIPSPVLSAERKHKYRLSRLKAARSTAAIAMSNRKK